MRKPTMSLLVYKAIRLSVSLSISVCKQGILRSYGWIFTSINYGPRIDSVTGAVHKLFTILTVLLVQPQMSTFFLKECSTQVTGSSPRMWLQEHVLLVKFLCET